MIILIILAYIIPLYFAFKMVQKSYYHPYGVFKLLNPSLSDYFFMFIPFVNIAPAIHYLVGGWKQERYRKNNFFKPNDRKLEKWNKNN